MPVVHFFKKVWLPIILTGIILFGFFLQKDIFFSEYNLDYAKNRYDFSQWMLPLSVRPIDDATLYQVAGYELTANGEYYTINPEVPPFGKYFYGWSIQLFGNPFLIGLPLFIASIVLFYSIARLVLADHRAVAIATILYSAEPLFISQMSQTLLDLPQLIGLLMHILGVLIFVKRYDTPFFRYGGILLAGVGLGWFISVKIAFFAVALIGSAFVLLWKEKKLVWIIPIIAISGLFYLAVYIPYFFSDKTLLDFLQDQKWMLSFYLTSSAEPLYGMFISVLFLGLEKGWWEDAVWSRVDQWNLFWPVFGIAPFLLLKNPEWRAPIQNRWFWYLLVYSVLIALCFVIVPFFARYFMLLFPVLILFTASLLARLPLKWVLFIFTLAFINMYLFLIPAIWKAEEQVESLIQRQVYQDLYTAIDKKAKQSISRDVFWRTNLANERELELERKEVRIDLSYAWPWETEVQGTIQLSYHTKYGSFDHEAPVTFIQQGGLWNLVWREDILFPGAVPGSKIEVQKDLPYRGIVQNTNGEVLSPITDRPFFSVVPDNVVNEEALRQQLADLTGVEPYDVEALYKVNHPPDEPQPIAFLSEELPAEVLESTTLEPGIVVEVQTTRDINRELLSKEQIPIVMDRLENAKTIIDGTEGGIIRIVHPDGSTQILVEREKEDGRDYVLED